MQAIDELPEGSVYRQFGSGELFIKTGTDSHEKAILDEAGISWSGDGEPLSYDPEEQVTVIRYPS